MIRRLLPVAGILLLAAGVLTPVITMWLTSLRPQTFSSRVRLINRAATPATLAQFQNFQSPQVLDQVITDLNLRAQWAEKNKQPADWPLEKSRLVLQRMISIEQSKGSQVFALRVFSDSPTEAAVIANRLAAVGASVNPGWSILETATPNVIPVGPNKPLNFVVSMGAGGFFAIIGILLLLAARAMGGTSRKTSAGAG